MVLQRWQTVYLLIAAVMFGLATFLPVLDLPVLQGQAMSVSLGNLLGGSVAIEGVQYAYVYYIITALCCLLSLVNIAKFKALKLQRTICSVTMLLTVVAYVVIALFYNMLGEIIASKWAIASLMPAFALICTFLAKKRIEHDYKLLHDEERLR